MYELASRIYSPKEMPLIGLAHRLTGDTEDIMATLQEFSYEAMKNNGMMRGWLSHILYFILVNPQDVEVILKSCLEKDDLHRFIKRIIGNGGIFAPVSIWRRRRKIMVPAFSPKIVESFVDVFSEQSEKLQKLMGAHDAGKDFSTWPYISSYTLDSVCETAMGVKINSQGNPDTPFLKSMGTLLNLVCMRIFHLWLQPEWLFRLFPIHKEHDANLAVMHNFTNKVIENKRIEIEQRGNEPEENYDHDLASYQTKTFLDLLITLSGREKGYTDTELREEVLTLTIAGTDTSAVAIGYTLKLLAKYPKIQDKVYQELYDVFGKSERPLVKEDLMKLSYLERVVKESLRLFPPVPFIIRKVLEEITLPSGRVLPAGSGVVVSIWGIHRDPKYWGSDADKFDPDRFLPERFKLTNTCSYMPFSSGPRNCLGYQYALMSIKTALSAIIRRYRILGEPEKTDKPKIRVKIDIMMKDVGGYTIALEKRTPQSNIVK